MGRENSGQEGVGRWGANHASRAPESGWPLPFHEVSGLGGLGGLGGFDCSCSRANFQGNRQYHAHRRGAFFVEAKVAVGKNKATSPKPPQPSTTVRAGCNARFLLREVHDSGALTGACTGKGPQMANPRPTPKQNARQLQLCSRPVSRSVK